MSKASPAVSPLTASRFEFLLAAEQREGRLPSVVAGVVRDGALAWSGSSGRHVGQVAAEAPTSNAQYRIGSLTKTMTAVLVLQLRDEGHLDLDDRLDEHVSGAPFGDQSIRRLLSHSGGLPSEPAGPWWERSAGVDFPELAARLHDQRSVFAPGSTFHYSNVAFSLLGQLVAEVSGSSWQVLLRERLLRPLGMHRTTYMPSPPAATGFSVHPFAGTLTVEPSHDAGAMAPAGQLWSTVADLARFALFLVSGHRDVLPVSTLEEMTVPRVGTTQDGLASGYGLGVRLVSGGSGTLLGHTGSMPGFLCGVYVDRRRRTGAVCLANATTGLRCDGLPRDLLTSLEELEPALPEPWTPNAVPSPMVAEILGPWFWGNTALMFTWDGSAVGVAPLGSTDLSHRFLPAADGTFLGVSGYHDGEHLHVVRDSSGQVNHLVCATFIYTRVPYDPAAPIPG